MAEFNINFQVVRYIDCETTIEAKNEEEAREKFKEMVNNNSLDYEVVQGLDFNTDIELSNNNIVIEENKD